jgi:uncharacterized membrane protein
MKSWWKQDSIALVVLVGMFVAALVLWPRMPEQLPVHWNAAGQADRWGSRAEGLLLLPAMTAGIYLLLSVLPWLDPRREHVTAFQGVLAVLRLTMVLFMAALYGVTLAYGLGRRLDMAWFTGISTGLIFIILGNYLPKVPSNWFVGVRTPWTLSSERSWYLTHRLAGKVFVIAGILQVLITLVRPQWSAIALAVLLVPSLLGITVYSYIVWKHDPDRLGNA